MCGVLGIVTAPLRQDSGLPGRFQDALNALGHRGPDARGQYRDRDVWLGHTRLSIIDLSSAGDQPMRSADGRFVISYNGEVYNYRELASSLSLNNLCSHSDTEVVLRAFASLGVDSFARLNGMFAFAIYDKIGQKLWLVRDRLGIKPLYYCCENQRLAFASEIKPLLRLMGEGPVCDLSGMHEWLYYGNSLGGRTLIQGLVQLPPGHYLELDIPSFTCEVREYWSLRHEARRDNQVQASPTEMIVETRRLLEQAVQRQLVSDVPVGIFLSGGVDSSAITAFAAKHYGARVTTYCAGFDDRSGVDERPKARRVAELFGTDHHEVEIGGHDVSGLVEKLVDHHGVPFFDAANIPLYRMASQISGTTKVILQGDGGDEVFGGYRRYVSLRLYRLLHSIARWAKLAVEAGPKSIFQQRVLRYLNAYGADDIGTTMGLLLTLEGAGESATSVFSPASAMVIAAHDPMKRYRSCQRNVADLDIGNQMSLVDLMIELPDIYLEKVDRATMAASLEVRVPFLDHELVDYVVRIPGPRKMPWGRKKWLLKQALAGIVPNDILYGPKTGFNVPFGYWLRTSLREFFFDHLATFMRERPGVLRPDVIHGWYAQYEAGREDHSERLWKIMNLMVWCNRFQVDIKV